MRRTAADETVVPTYPVTAQLAQKQKELETTLNVMKDNMVLFERRYKRRGTLLLEIAKLLSDELQMHRVSEILERELFPPRKAEKLS